MKILVTAIACNPFTGSEASLGWFALRSISELAELWILVGKDQEIYLEKCKADIPANVHLVYVGDSKPYVNNRLLARFQSWWRYIKFNRTILRIAQDLHQEIGFDLVHHITYSTWRVANPLWRLGIPFVWGPVSGTEVFPLWKFGSILSPSARAFEFARLLSGCVSRFSREVNQCAQHAFHIFAAHGESVPPLFKLRGKQDGVSILSYYSLSPEIIAKFTPRTFRGVTNRPLKILAGGNLEGRKGIAIALQGLALVKMQGVKFCYRVTSQGPEQHYLELLAQQLGLQQEVSIGKKFDQEEYVQELQDTDLFLLPSLREGGGTTMMEAMLAGAVPIVANCGGPGTAVTDECGIRIPIESPLQMARDIAAAVIRFDNDRELLARMGESANSRIAQNYTERRFIETVEAVYRNALASKQE